MVYSRFGCEVKAIKNFNLNTGRCEVLITSDDGKPDEWIDDYSIGHLKADGGFPEVEQLAKRVG